MVLLPLAIMGLLIGIVLAGLSEEHVNPRVCEQCRYDLRGTPSRRCPECGHENGPIEGPPRNLIRSAVYVTGVAITSVSAMVLVFYLLAGLAFVLPLFL